MSDRRPAPTGRRPAAPLLPPSWISCFFILLYSVGPVEPENLRRFLLVPVRALQRLQDGHLLDFGQRPMRRNHELRRRGALGPQRLRQVVDGDLAALGDQHAALDHVLQLADVARPPVPDEHVVRRRRDGLHVALVPLPVLLEKVLAQQRDVLGPLAQRRHAQRDRVDAEIQVLAQLAVAQRRVEIDVRRANQPEVDADDAVAADRAVLALLQHPEQLGLQIRAASRRFRRGAASRPRPSRTGLPCRSAAPVNAPFL